MAAPGPELLPDILLRIDDGGAPYTIFVLKVAPGMTVGEGIRLIDRALSAGVGAVWVVFPNLSRVYVYTSPTAVRILSRDEELTGEPVLPGFRLPLADLFPPPDEPQ